MNYEKLLQVLGPKLGDLAVSLHNWNQYRVRQSGDYLTWFNFFSKEPILSLDELMSLQKDRLAAFLEHATSNSEWYRQYRGAALADYPILQKEDLVKHQPRISTLSERDGIASYTGGTTGASLKVLYTRADLNERFGMLDSFRSEFGYKLGEPVAWFSGKHIVFENDRKASRYWRTDKINRIRFYSTFDISGDSAQAYWEDLLRFQPRYVVGFPSSVCELAKFAEAKGLDPLRSVNVFFPTAETVTQDHRQTVSRVFSARTVDQYASSEGAPFITECVKGRLHMRLLSGVFEVLDSEGCGATSGDLVVTSFSTRGTPLIRYNTGDRIELDEIGSCDCGSPMPLVGKIFGRTTDYLLNLAGEKVNLGNLSNCTKNTSGIVKIQFIQESRGACNVKVQASESFKESDMATLRKNIEFALGAGMVIKVVVVDNIPRERSGKYRIVKNLIDDGQ